jgi:hypothetical protein
LGGGGGIGFEAAGVVGLEVGLVALRVERGWPPLGEASVICAPASWKA